MALDKNELISLIATNIPDNTNQEITPLDVRQVLEQMVTSDANLEDDAGYASIGDFISIVTQTGLSDVASTVTFGSGGTTTDGSVTVGSNGEVTVNETAYYSIKQRFRTGRTGSSGVSEMFFWAEVSADGGATWLEIGNSVDISLNNADDSVLFFDISYLYLQAGIMLRNRFARSSDGNNSGDLVPKDPSSALQALGVPTAPSAQLTISRLFR